MRSGLSKRESAVCMSAMNIKSGDVVEVWTGAATGSPFPPKPGDAWEEAEVLEVRNSSCWISWTSSRPGCPWVPMSAVRKSGGEKT